MALDDDVRLKELWDARWAEVERTRNAYEESLGDGSSPELRELLRLAYKHAGDRWADSVCPLPSLSQDALAPGQRAPSLARWSAPTIEVRPSSDRRRVS
jgi:hypothetical protein